MYYCQNKKLNDLNEMEVYLHRPSAVRKYMSISNETETEANPSYISHFTFHIHHSYLIENWKIDAHGMKRVIEIDGKINKQKNQKANRSENRPNQTNHCRQPNSKCFTSAEKKNNIESTKQNITVAAATKNQTL